MDRKRRVLVAGGSSGIGLATARAFAEAGDSVTIAGRSPDKLAAALKTLPDGVTAEPVDALSDASVAELFGRLGPLHDLVLTVGAGAAMGRFETLGVSAIAQTLETKLMAQARLAHAALEHLNDDGTITFLGGVAGRRPLPGMTAVGVANLGLQALASALAKELAPLRVNLIAPGLVDTPAYAGMPTEARTAMLQATADALPVGRVGQAEDIAAAIFAVVRNGYITGAEIEVDGGAHL